MFKRGILLGILCVVPLRCLSQTPTIAALPLQQCIDPGVQAQLSGLLSINFMMGVIPQCTVTIYITGTTTLATYYTSIGGSPLSGPFTASPQGQFLVYVSNAQGYDVVFSGGIPPNTYAQPVTVVGVGPPGTGGGGGGGTPGTPLTSVQVNVGGVFTGYATLTYTPSGGLDIGGPITGTYVTIGPHAPPVANWTFDTFSPLTAALSINALSTTYTSPQTLVSYVTDNVTGTYNGSTFVPELAVQSDGANCNTMYSGEQGVVGGMAAVAGCVNVPVGQITHQPNAVLGVIQNNTPGNNAVGVYGQGVAAVANTQAWGMNCLGADVAGLLGGTQHLWCLEADVNVNSATTQAKGLDLIGAWGAQPTTTEAIDIEQPLGGSYFWPVGIQIESAATGAAIYIDPSTVTAGGGGSPSQPIIQNAWSAGGLVNSVTQNVDNLGNFTLTFATAGTQQNQIKFPGIVGNPIIFPNNLQSPYYTTTGGGGLLYNTVDSRVGIVLTSAGLDFLKSTLIGSPIGVVDNSGNATFSGAITGASIVSTASGCTSGSPYLQYTGSCGNGGGGGGGGTVTTTGSPATGSLTAFSGATSITNATAAQLGTLVNQAVNSILFSGGTTSAISAVAPVNSAVLVTSSGGVPSESTTLPNGLALGTPTSGIITNLTGTCTACNANTAATATTATTATNVSGGTASVTSLTVSAGYRLLGGYSPGVAQASATSSIGGLGGNFGNFTTGITSGALPLMPFAGTIYGLYVSCGAHGVSSGDGIFVVVKQASGSAGPPSTTSMTVTYGSGQTVNAILSDTTHSFTFAAGDRLGVQVTTLASTTLADCAVDLTY